MLIALRKYASLKYAHFKIWSLFTNPVTNTNLIIIRRRKQKISTKIRWPAELSTSQKSKETRVNTIIPVLSPISVIKQNSGIHGGLETCFAQDILKLTELAVRISWIMAQTDDSVIHCKLHCSSKSGLVPLTVTGLQPYLPLNDLTVPGLPQDKLCNKMATLLKNSLQLGVLTPVSKTEKKVASGKVKCLKEATKSNTHSQ